MLIKWYRDNMGGKETAFLPEGFTWRTTPELNSEFWDSYQDVSLDEAKRLLKKSHEEIVSIIKAHTNDELFKKGVYKWTGTTTLGAYFISATSSHYDWARKLLRKM